MQIQRGFIQALILLLVSFLLAGTGYYFRNEVNESFVEIPVSESVDKIETDIISEEKVAEPQEIVVETPLRREIVVESPPVQEIVQMGSSTLSVDKIFEHTNEQRIVNGLAPFILNPKLSAAATLKVEDMFFQQYFEHASPNGDTVGDLADTVSYEYILVGENLALGNYDDNEDLVQAWMDSQGHRENILHDRYREIGIAVREGDFEGERTWLAVQEFGLPLSACQSISETLNEQIETNRNTLDTLSETLEKSLEDLANTKPKYGVSYNNKVKAHNNIGEIYNELIEETKALIEKYNIQVHAFNECASG